MFDLECNKYPYMEEVNEGILRQLRHVHRPGRLLDVGCGRGQLGEALQRLGWKVWGIEKDIEASAIAENRLARVIRADITDSFQINTLLENEKFSALVFSDVLEHIYDPLQTLKQYLKYLATGGTVFLSVPNAVVWTNRFKWLLGYVNYKDTGVMDRTHIRFFTFKTAKLLVTMSGCKIKSIDLCPHLTRAFLPIIKSILVPESSNPRLLVDSKLFNIYSRYIYPFEHFVASFWKGMFAFRIIVVAEKL